MNYMIRIVVFASGSGTNAENIINHFNNSSKAVVTNVLCNNPTAKVFDRCEKLNVPCSLFEKDTFFKENTVLHFLQQKNTDFIILAGFLWKIPKNILSAFPNKIINIHPALLPKYGGKGMYGMYVHNAVKANNESETGITIHYVNEVYDEGEKILVKEINLNENETVESLENRIKELESVAIVEAFEKLLAKS